MQVGVTAWTSRSGWRADELCQQAQALESLGFHSLWLPENHFGDQRALPSPLTLLAAAAAGTRHIRLATTSYLLPIRHPIMAAEEVAVLDQLSGGRVMLGVGRGIQGAVFRTFDLPASDKRKRFQANLEIMLRAWQGEPILTDEELEPVHLAPLPLQRPHPPVWVAAFGPLALRQAGSLGLPYLASPLESLAVLQQNYALYHQAVAEAGHAAVKTIPVMRTLFVSDNKRPAQDLGEKLQRAVPAAMKDKAGDLGDWAIIGDRFRVRDKLGEYVERLGLSYLVIRGGLPGVSDSEQQASHQQLLEIAQDIS